MFRLWRPILFLSLAVFLVFGSFAAGVVAARQLPGLAAPLARIVPSTQSDDAASRLALVQEALRVVERDYYQPDALHNQDLVYGAIRGMLQPLGDPYTAFASPRQAEMQSEDLSGRVEGIGAILEVRAGKLTVAEPQAGTPAEKAGLKIGDVITHVDGKPSAGLSLTDAVALIRGPRGTSVVLAVVRSGQPPFEVAVARAEVKYQYVRWEMLPGDVAYLRLTTFAEVTRDFVNALRDIKQQQARAVVLDLRGNPGGYLEVALDVASQFLEPGLPVYQQERGGERQVVAAKRGGIAGDLPLAVLVDRYSASAAEVVAGALQDHGRAMLVGEKTIGKGSVQRIHTLSDRSTIRVTYAQWLTPKGREINKKGLEPDLPVQNSPDPPHDKSEDIVLQRALAYLSQQAMAKE
ncbi:MAG: S41 family peptidase [Chloroflexota bacterium]